MLNFELSAKFRNHSIIEIGSIIGDDPFRDTILAYEVVSDESGYHILCDRGKRSGFDPLGEIINSDQNEAMSIGSGWLDLSNHVKAPHCKWPRSGHDFQRDKRHMDLVGINLAFVASPRVLMEISLHC